MKLPVFTLALSLAAAAAVAAVPAAPVFAPGTTVDTIQGVKVADPYRALENGSDPKVEAWSDAQNTRTREYLDSIPGREAVAAKLRRLITAASPAYGALQAQGATVFALYNDPAKQQPSLVMLNVAADPASRTAVLDPNVLDADGPYRDRLVHRLAGRDEGGGVAVQERQRGRHAARL